MKCPLCTVEMKEHTTYWACSLPETECSQIPICKGCLEPCVIAEALDYFCNNPECPRTPHDNLRDLVRLNPCQVPPEGWTCTREGGHPGPCAAIPKISELASYVGMRLPENLDLGSNRAAAIQVIEHLLREATRI